MMIQR